jgi:hypothetical protein
MSTSMSTAWTPVTDLRDRGGGRFTGTVDPSRATNPDDYVSLRVEAWDADGNRIEQTVVRAYALP